MNYREPIKKLKTMRDRELVEMAVSTGLSVWTLRAIRAGRTTGPRLSTIESIARYLDGLKKKAA